MVIKTIEIYVCDNCGAESTVKKVVVNDVPNKGCSEIENDHKTFLMEVGHYCDLNCLFQKIRKRLDDDSK